MLYRALSQIVKHVAIDQGFKIGTQQHIGRGFLRVSINNDTYRVVRAGLNAVIKVGSTTAPLIFTLPLGLQRDCYKGRVLNLNGRALDRRDQVVTLVLVAAQTAREKVGEGFAGDSGTVVDPGTVTGNTH